MTNLMKKNIKLVNMLVIMGLVLAFAQNFAANYTTNRTRALEFLDPHHVVIIQTYVINKR